MMRYENPVLQQVVNMRRNAIKRGRINHHLIGYAGKCCDRPGNRATGINQCTVPSLLLPAIVQDDSNFGDGIAGGKSAGGFYVDDGVHEEVKGEK